MKITYLGHACWHFEIQGISILIDPFISGNELASNINIDEIKADYIFLTHGHEDHVADAERIAKNNNSTIVSNFEVVNWYSNKGIEKVHPMNLGGTWDFEFGSVTFVTAIHSSSMPDGSYGGNPGGFVFITKEANFYHSGDTALTFDMKLIPILAKIDFAFLPIGDNFTMNVDTAKIASDFIECNQIFAMHFDTFGYIKINKEQATTKFEDAGKTLIFLNIGQALTI